MEPYAIISDIHANLEALEAVLEDIDKKNIQKIVCLGDVIGYGPSPCEVLKKVSEVAEIIMCGNHDYAGVFEEGKAQMGKAAQFALIKNLQQMYPTRLGKFFSQFDNKIPPNFLVELLNILALCIGFNYSMQLPVSGTKGLSNWRVAKNAKLKSKLKQNQYYQILDEMLTEPKIENGVEYIHAIPADSPGITHDETYINSWDMAQLAMLAIILKPEDHPDVHTCVYGHTHKPAVYFAPRELLTDDSETIIDFRCDIYQSIIFKRRDGGPGTFSNNSIVLSERFLEENILLLGAGSVGQPRDGDKRASYLIHWGDKIDNYRVSYDVEKTIMKFKKLYRHHPFGVDMINIFSERIRLGK